MIIDQKDLELQEWEEKYKKYTEKAKTVSKCMDINNIVLSDTDKSALQNRLIKANEEINDLKVCIIRFLNTVYISYF